MSRIRFRPTVPVRSMGSTGIVVALVGGNLLFNVLANASFKVSADSRTWREFLLWQVVGNLAGLVTVLTLTGLLRHMPLHVAFPLTTGLAVLGVQVGAAWLLFRESVTPAQWMGTLLVVVGILLIGGR
jgi:multidrug transporter EmrE-like cation transporter